MEITVGERVRVKKYEELPPRKKNRGISKICGKEGKVVDKLFSEMLGGDVYRILLDGKTVPSSILFAEDMLDPIEEQEQPTYRYEFEFLDKVVVCRLYEVNGDTETEVAKGHGHIIHEGVYGVAQASSYALKRICDNINGGSLRVFNNK